MLHVSGASGSGQLRLTRNNAASNGNDYGRIYFESTDDVLTGQISVARESAENDGYMHFKTASGGTLTERMRITSSGRVGIGTTSPGAQLHTYASGSDGLQMQTASYQSYVWQIESSGNLFNGSQAGELGLRGQSGIGFCANNGSTAHFRIESDGDLVGTDTSIGSISDSRVKKNIADYTYDLAKFKQLTPKTFDWINPEEHLKDTNVRGFLAQDVKTIDDYWIKETNSVNKLDKELIGEGKALSSKLGASDAMYVSVIKQLIAKIETLETKVAALEAHTHE